MADEKNPLIEMLRRIRADIFDRLRRGKVIYAGDTTTLRKHLEVAREMGDQSLESTTLNMLGVIDLEYGYFSSAEAYLHHGYEIAARASDFTMMAGSQTNLGEIYRRMGRFEEAIASFQAARLLGEEIGHKRAIVIAENNTGLALLSLGDYDGAAACFRKVFEITADDPWQYITTLIESHNGLADIYLTQGNFDQAWQHTADAERLATERDYQIPLAQTQIAKAHIAEADPERRDDAQEYYRMAREGLRNHGTPVNLARTLLEEARYQHRHGNMDDVRRLAGEASQMFHGLNLPAEAELAELLLKSFPTIM